MYVDIALFQIGHLLYSLILQNVKIDEKILSRTKRQVFVPAFSVVYQPRGLTFVSEIRVGVELDVATVTVSCRAMVCSSTSYYKCL